jgi:hypothetical protein
LELRRISNRWLIIASLIILIAPTTILALLNYSNQQPLWSFTTYGWANSVALTSDGSNVALGIATQCCGPSRSGQVLLLDKTGRTLWSFGTDSAINSVDISPDGSHIAAAGYLPGASINDYSFNGAVYYFDHSGNQLWTRPVQAHGGPGSLDLWDLSIRISLDGARVFVNQGVELSIFSSQGQSLWNYTTDTPLRSTANIFSGALVSPDFSFAAMLDNSVHAFNGQGVSTWNSTEPQAWITGAAISPDSRYLAVADEIEGPTNNGTLFLFNKTGALIWTRPLKGATTTISFSPDDSTIINQGGGTASLDLRNRVLWNYTNGGARSLAVTSDGSCAVTGMYYPGQESIRIFNSQGALAWGGGGGGWVQQIAISSDNSYTAVAYGPYSSPSTDSATLLFYDGPKNLISQRGPTYSFLYFDHDTNTLPTILIFPAAFAVIPLVFLFARRRRTRSGTQNPASVPQAIRIHEITNA